MGRFSLSFSRKRRQHPPSEPEAAEAGAGMSAVSLATSQQTQLTPSPPTKRANPSQETETGREDEGRLGMFILASQPKDETKAVDIVALHGLNGHYYNTWSAPESQLTKGNKAPPVMHNWLEKDLADALPNARIMSYGYDSAVFSKSVADVGTFADQLLEELIAVRGSVAERERPLLFVCHSLGGIVFKKALIRARERDRYEETLKRVRGVAFFGTPHRGSSVADWTNILGRVVDAASLGFGTNPTLLKDLATQSKVLVDIYESFVDRGKGLKIVSFYETEKLHKTNFVVVEKWSAALHVPNETTVPLVGDHRSICRFSDSSEDKRRIKVVLRHLSEMATEALSTDVTFVTKLSEQEQLEALRNLYPGDYESFMNVNVDRVPGTCEWLLHHKEYRSWREGKDSILLWVSADAGCGKSTLAKFLVNHLKFPTPTSVAAVSVCHFFFKEGISKQQTAISGIRAILHQIFARDRALMRHMFGEYETKGEKMMDELDTLVSVLMNIVKDPEAPSFIFILDGLDECSDAELIALLKGTDKIYAQNYITSRQNQYLKVLMLSRPENSIKNKLKRQPMTIRLRGEDEIESIGKDVSLLIQHCMRDFGEEGMPSILLKEFSQSLEAGADNTFLWVTLMLQILRDHNKSHGGVSRNEILKLLKSRDIFDVYNHLLGKVGSKTGTGKMLRIVLAAERPLSVAEMSIALAVSMTHNTLEDISSDIKFPCEDHVKSLGGHFIRIIRNEVHLVHQTAREFLLDRQQAKNSTSSCQWQHSFTMDHAHKTLLGSCVSYLVCGERSGWANPLIVEDCVPDQAPDPQPKPQQPKSEEKVEDAGWEADSELLPKVVQTLPLRPRHPNSEANTESIAVPQNPHPFLFYASQSWPFHFKSSAPDLEDELFCHAQKLCNMVSEAPGYPIWTLAKPKTTHFQGVYWDSGAKGGCYVKQVRILFGLRIHAFTTGFIKPSAGIAVGDGYTLLHLAAALGCVEDFRWLIEACEGADLNIPDSQSEMILNLVIQRGAEFAGLPELLITLGASVTARGRDGRTALHHAANVGPASLVQLLIDKGADTNVADTDGATPLWCATDANEHAIVELLLAHRPDINARGRGNKAIIHLAADTGSASMLGKILEQHPNVNVVDGDGYSPMRYIRRRPTMNFSVVRPLASALMEEEDDEEQRREGGGCVGDLF